MHTEIKDHLVEAHQRGSWVGWFCQDGSLVGNRADSQPLTASDARILAQLINGDPQHAKAGVRARPRRIRR